MTLNIQSVLTQRHCKGHRAQQGSFCTVNVQNDFDLYKKRAHLYGAFELMRIECSNLCSSNSACPTETLRKL